MTSRPAHFCIRLLIFAACTTLPALAADSEPIHRAIDAFLLVQAKNFPGPARHNIGSIAAGGLAEGCRRISVSMSPGARPWGRTHVQARCTDGAIWSLFVPVDIHVTANYLVSARPLRAGQVITETDLARRQGDLAELPGNVLIDATQAIGLTANATLPAGRPLQSDMLRKPLVIHQGQNTKISFGGTGFQVASEGKALGNAVAGQVVQLRMASGQTLSGIAQPDGSVRIGP